MQLRGNGTYAGPLSQQQVRAGCKLYGQQCSLVYRDKEVGSVVSRNEYMAGSLLSAISKAGRYDQGG